MKLSLAAVLYIVCILMNLVTFCLMAADKSFAKRRKCRIPEKTLFLCAALFGAPGGILGMLLCRHKTKHIAFVIGFPLLALLQVILFILL